MRAQPLLLEAKQKGHQQRRADGLQRTQQGE
jgi:hypothetical protein